MEDQLVDNPSDEEVEGLMKSIEPCIWKINPMTKKVSNKKETHIKTLVATDDDKIDFDLILEKDNLVINRLLTIPVTILIF